MTYRIKGWDAHFEKSQTRKCSAMKWVPVSNKHDGKSYRRIMRMERRAEIYAVWVLLIQVASKCPVRGILEDSDGPLTPDDLELKTGMPADSFAYAMPVLASNVIGWLETDCDQTTSTLPADSQHAPSTLPARYQHGGAPVGLQDRTGQDITEQEILSHSPQTASDPVGDVPRPPQSYRQDFGAFYDAYPRKVCKDDAARKYETVQKRLQAQNAWDRVEVAGYLVERAKAYARSRVGKESKFTPHPSTWLNQGRYLDDDAEWNRTDNARGIVAAGDGQVAAGDSVGW